MESVKVEFMLLVNANLIRHLLAFCVRSAIRRVADAMDSVDDKRITEKFSNSFQSTFRR